MDWIVGLLPLLAFAACPLMMVFCFFGMRKMGCATESAPAASAATAPAQNLSLSSSAQIVALQAQLSQLQSEQLAIARQIDELATASTDPASPAPSAVATAPAGTSV